jgi:phenylacetate-coenzyme A ligase PaaK-like adenylate-forming protein
MEDAAMPFSFNPWPYATVGMGVWMAGCWPAPALAALQAQRLHALLQAAQRESPWIGRIARGCSPERLADWPVMHKAEAMRHFDDWVTDPRLKLDALRRFMARPEAVGQPFVAGCHAWESSGSSGEPAIFVQDAQALAVYDALEAARRPVLLWRRWLDPAYLGERLAFVGATGGHFASTVSVERLRRLQPWLAGRLQGHSFLQPMADLVDALNRQAPTVLMTYPSTALLLAEEASAGRLRLPLCELWTGGEGLSPAMRARVSAAFGCPVAQSYGASEFLSLASECRCQRLHLNADWVVLESVDEHHRPVPDGHPGSTTLLTNLANRVQPLIRFELGDRIVLHGPQRCACGSALPVIEVQGRVDDLLSLADASGRTVRLSPLALVTVLEDDAGVFDFQLEQQHATALSLHVGTAGEAGRLALQRAERALSRFLCEQGLQGVRIKGRCGEPGHAGRSGKVQRVVARQCDAAEAVPA